jgi:hypothetical protein
MIDPATAIGMATVAFNGIKKAVAVGKEISELSGDISKFGKAMSDLNYLGDKAKDPPLWKRLDPKFDTSAIEIWAAQQKAEQMREELRQHISLYYGPSAWERIVQIEAEQRKMQKEAVYRRQEKIDNLINTAIVIGLSLVSVIAAVIFIYLMGRARGKW